MPHKSAYSGFSLIEVLISLLLTTVGILGMVTLQVRAVQYTQDSVQRNTAMTLTNDLIELMRAMPDSLSDFYKAKGTAFPEAPDSCTPLSSEVSEQLGCWSQKAKLALPDAESLLTEEFYICRISGTDCTASGNAIEVQVAWRVKAGECMDAEQSATDDTTICRYRLRTQI